MAEEKLKFMDLLAMVKVIDDDDRVRRFEDAIESQFSLVSKKVSEYGRDGKLVIEVKFAPDKKNKNGVSIFAEVKKTIPKGSQANQFFRDSRTGGLYLEDPDQLKLFNSEKVVPHTSGKDAAAQNND